MPQNLIQSSQNNTQAADGNTFRRQPPRSGLDDCYALNPDHSEQQFHLQSLWSPEVSTHITYLSLGEKKKKSTTIINKQINQKKIHGECFPTERRLGKQMGSCLHLITQ